jgi:hypothetical protein
MTEPTITCPSCHAVIPLTQQLAAPLLAAERRTIAAREAEVAKARAALDAEVATRVAAERERLAGEEADKARAAAAAELAELRAMLASRDAKLNEAQAAQAEALRQMRALEDARRELDLTVEQRVSEALGVARDQARAAAEEAMRLKVAEKEATITAMQRTIEDLKRRSEQGSQQIQGEVMELDLEATLAARFPADSIEPVGKGVAGADLIQRVVAPGGVAAGVILWEAKRTRAWNDDWLVKLRTDQRALGADVALIMSEALPKGVECFDLVDGVWVAGPRYALPLATALRAALIDLGAMRAARAGQGTKMELVYDYLTGPRFRHRVEAIVEKFTDMATDLDREKKAMQRLWAKRETQIAGVLEATVGMYGDLQGIAGRALGEIEGLEMPLLDGPDE